MRDDEKKKLHQNLKQEIRSLLISSPKTKYGGLSGSLLYFDYKQLNCGKEVPYAQLGFHSFLGLLRSMPDVVRIEYKENSPSYRAHPVYDQSTAHIQKMVLEQRDKYEDQNRLYNQNWHSNQRIPVNFYNDSQVPFFQNCLPFCTVKSVQPNVPVFQNSSDHKFNNSFRRSFPQDLSVPNKCKRETNFEPYVLLTPPDNQKEDQKLNFDDHEVCSTPNTFLSTPPNFDLDDYQLNQSIESTEKEIDEENPIHSSINNQNEIEDNPLFPTSNDISPNKKDDPSISSSESIPNILPIIIDEKSPLALQIIFETPRCDEQEQPKIDENEMLIKRLNNAIRECIHFRYIHRLCEIKFEYRHYPLSYEIFSTKSKLEKFAFNQYEQELKDLEKRIELNSSINDQICQTMFDQYICLQRNYYYMIKLINKIQR